MNKIAAKKEKQNGDTTSNGGSKEQKGKPHPTSPSFATISFKDLPNDLKKILLDLEKSYQIAEIIDDGIILYKANYENLRKALKENYDANTLKFIDHMFTYNFQYYNDLRWMPYLPLLNHSKFICPVEISQTPISTPEENGLKDENREGSSRYPDPHPSAKNEEEAGSPQERDIRDTPIKEACSRIKQVQETFGIQVSKTALDHSIEWFGKFNLNDKDEGPVFAKLEQGLKVEYQNNTWAYPIKDEDGYLLKVHVQKNTKRHLGTVRVFVARQFDIESVFQENYFEVFHFFSIREHAVFLSELRDRKTEEFIFKLFSREEEEAVREEIRRILDELEAKKEDQIGEPLLKEQYKVELANAIGPRYIVDNLLKGAHISCELCDGAGGKDWVDCTVDYSLGFPEIEIKGKKFQSSLLRDWFVDGAKLADSICTMNQNLRNDHRKISKKLNVIGSEVHSNGQVLLQVQEGMERIENGNTEILTALDMNHQESKQHFDTLIESVQQTSQNLKTTSDNLGQSLILIRNGFEGVENLKEQNTHIMFTGDCIFSNTEDIISKIDNLDKNINQRFDSLQDLITTKFEDSRKDFQVSLKKTLKKIEEFSEEHSILAAMRVENEIGKSENNLISYLQSELRKSRSTIYNYLNELQEKGLIISVTKKGRKGKGRGRPGKQYLINFQIQNLLKKERITIT